MGFFLKKKLQQRSAKRTSKVAIALSGALLILFAVRPAHAENLVITQPTDFWFHYDSSTTFSARTYDIPNHPSDPQLWLYNSEGSLITTNDDWYGLQSHIQTQVEPGWYRLRAGTCCYEPDVWRTWDTTWNIDYELSVEGVTNPPTTTTIQETTTTEEMWTTTSSISPISEPSTTLLPTLLTTTVPEPTSTTTSTTTTTTSTTLAPPPLTTLPAVTTTLPPSTTSSSTSSTSPPTTNNPTTTVTQPPRTTSTSTVTATTVTTIPPTTVTPTTATPSSVQNPTTTTTLPATLPETVTESITALQQDANPEQVTAAIQEIAANLDTLTTEQLDEIANTVSKAPKAVKQKFESEINIFGGGLDNYVPVGSTVNVGERRTLVVIGAVLTAMPVIAPKRK